MNSTPVVSVTAFAGLQRLTTGTLPVVARQVRRALGRDPLQAILVFDDRSGRIVDIDPRGVEAEESSAIVPTLPEPPSPSEPRGRGRPKLGVVAREVTLLPRHWDWLAAQPGGASVALRKLVDEARRAHGEKNRRREAQESAYRFMSAIAGDLPGFEEATRALFADDRTKFQNDISAWPGDVRDYVLGLAFQGGNNHE